MLSANFKPKRTAVASRGFLATARLSCLNTGTITALRHSLGIGPTQKLAGKIA